MWRCELDSGGSIVSLTYHAFYGRGFLGEDSFTMNKYGHAIMEKHTDAAYFSPQEIVSLCKAKREEFLDERKVSK